MGCVASKPKHPIGAEEGHATPAAAGPESNPNTAEFSGDITPKHDQVSVEREGDSIEQSQSSDGKAKGAGDGEKGQHGDTTSSTDHAGEGVTSASDLASTSGSSNGACFPV